MWLREFRDLPSRTGWALDWYLERFPPRLALRPEPSLLTSAEADGLRTLFKDYAFDLLKVQKQSDVRNWIDGAGILASVAATWVTPIGLPATIFGAGVFVRNRMADRAWKRRLKDLAKLAEWIRILL